jgi:excinuclease ABC subunit C
MGRYLEQADLSPHDANRNDGFAALPDLVVIDGGKGQLAAGMRALEPLTERGVAVISLAKRIEEVFVPGRKQPIRLRKGSDALRLLQRVRDEAHRFAITYHRKERGKIRSQLDAIPGVGPAKRRALLKRFGSVAGVKQASIEELSAVPGISAELAERIREGLAQD